jgi:hypothetical protein
MNLNIKNQQMMLQSKVSINSYCFLTISIFYLGKGSYLYSGITITVALIVFVLYMWLVK